MKFETLNRLNLWTVQRRLTVGSGGRQVTVDRRTATANWGAQRDYFFLSTRIVSFFCFLVEAKPELLHNPNLETDLGPRQTQAQKAQNRSRCNHYLKLKII